MSRALMGRADHDLVGRALQEVRDMLVAAGRVIGRAYPYGSPAYRNTSAALQIIDRARAILDGAAGVDIPSLDPADRLYYRRNRPGYCQPEGLSFLAAALDCHRFRHRRPGLTPPQHEILAGELAAIKSTVLAVRVICGEAYRIRRPKIYASLEPRFQAVDQHLLAVQRDLEERAGRAGRYLARDAAGRTAELDMLGLAIQRAAVTGHRAVAGGEQ